MEQQDNKPTVSLQQFIHSLGYDADTAAMMATAPWLKPFCHIRDNEQTGEQTRLAIIGTGSRGQYLMKHLLAVPCARIVALCDNYLPNLNEAKVICPDATTHTDYRQLLDDPDIDGVVIATPLHLHASMTIDALHAGKHVFCEKAMALTLDECRAVYDVYTHSDRMLYYCMQRMFDEKYIKAMELIGKGLIGEIVGFRCHWFRNADWRRPVPSPEQERSINWRLYKETSGGLMTELGSHQLEVCTWAARQMPQSVVGFGDIVYWKDGREVADSVNATFHYANGLKIAYESLIANKFNGMVEEVLGSKGTMDLAKGVYYFEDELAESAAKDIVQQVKDKTVAPVPMAGASWRSEARRSHIPHPVLRGRVHTHSGASMVGADNDGSDIILAAFCHSCLTGERVVGVVEEAYSATTLCLLANQAMEEGRRVDYPDAYKIPYMKF